MSKTISCLIIDDDPDDREIFMMCIEKLDGDIDCSAISDGVEALDMLVEHPNITPDYIFLDVNMPKLNGIDCLKELRKMERLGNTRILMYSTSSERKVIEESRRYGADDFIVKPSKVAELKETLHDIFATDGG